MEEIRGIYDECEDMSRAMALLEAAAAEMEEWESRGEEGGGRGWGVKGTAEGGRGGRGRADGGGAEAEEEAEERRRNAGVSPSVSCVLVVDPFVPSCVCRDIGSWLCLLIVVGFSLLCGALLFVLFVYLSSLVHPCYRFAGL